MTAIRNASLFVIPAALAIFLSFPSTSWVSRTGKTFPNLLFLNFIVMHCVSLLHNTQEENCFILKFCYTYGMAYGAQLPVRLETAIEARLDLIAKKTGTSKSALIRLLAATFVEHAIDANGAVKLPPDWDQLLPRADRRSVNSNAGKSVETSAASDGKLRKLRKQKFGK